MVPPCQEERAPVELDIRIWGMAADGGAFSQHARTQNISSSGARVFLGSLRNGTPKVQMWIAQALTQMASALSPDQLKDMLSELVVIFREFGDGSTRADAAWGWRTVGNAMLACGQRGREMLEAMRTERRGADQRQHQWLAWVAYQVLYVPQSPEKATLCEEKEAVETHAKYAPPFPGWRA